MHELAFPKTMDVNQLPTQVHKHGWGQNERSYNQPPTKASGMLSGNAFNPPFQNHIHVSFSSLISIV